MPVNTNPIIYLHQFSILSCEFYVSFLPNDEMEMIDQPTTLLSSAFSPLVKIRKRFKYKRFLTMCVVKGECIQECQPELFYKKAPK